MEEGNAGATDGYRDRANDTKDRVMYRDNA